MSICRAFILVEGTGHVYPAYESATVRVTSSDPTAAQIGSSFYCSPIYSLDPEGVSSLPSVSEGSVISFFIVPSAASRLAAIRARLELGNQAWFSLGLANIVVFDEPQAESHETLGARVEQELRRDGALVAVERWEIGAGRITSRSDITPAPVVQVPMPRNEHLPLHLRFTILEYFSTAEQVLTASQVFAPQYLRAYQHIFEAGADLVSDLAFLHGGSDAPASDYLRDLDPEDAKAREDHINDRAGRLVQLVSALSYIQSQSYFGAFPLLSQGGIICRHSLLGIGSAVAALFEIVTQLEEAFYKLPFEDMYSGKYAEDPLPSSYVVFDDPRQHNVAALEEDQLRAECIRRMSPERYERPEEANVFFGRFAFFSGRLGFREYDYSATAALQVLVEASSLRWNVINYTHEIIHNHVRIIIDRIMAPPADLFEDWCGEQVRLEERLLRIHSARRHEGLSRSDYIRHVLVSYCTNGLYYGSLSKKWNAAKYDEWQAMHHGMPHYRLPTAVELGVAIKGAYRDISEIFVHILDFNYVYKQDLEAYVDGIWSSWAAITEVWDQLDSYILRTLLVAASLERGDPILRFRRSVDGIRYIASQLQGRRQTSIFKRIGAILNEPAAVVDFEHRFINCLPVADVARHFFVGRVEIFLNRGDNRVLPRSPESEFDGGRKAHYDVERGKFDPRPTSSKVRFALDQLINTIYLAEDEGSEEVQERTSAWLLLCLSMNDHERP